MHDNFDLLTDTLTDREISILQVERRTVDPDAPRVIVLHGLYGRKEDYLEEIYYLARRGFRATAIDLFLHGERQNSRQLPDLITSNYIGTIQAVVYETAKDITALLDHWGCARNNVGLLAISAGGLAAHAVCVSEPRIGAVAAVITSPDWSTADPQVSPEPGSPLAKLLESLSPVNSPAAYPPKALLMLVGETDEVVSPIGSTLLYNRLLPLYNEMGIVERLELKVFPGLGHVYTGEMRELSLNWLETHLLKNNSPV